jgi:hypothetical protein
VNKCVDKLVDTFLTTGRSPKGDVACQGEGIPAPSGASPKPAARAVGVPTRSPLTRIAELTNAVSGS